jgi:cell division protein FtsB
MECDQFVLPQEELNFASFCSEIGNFQEIPEILIDFPSSDFSSSPECLVSSTPNTYEIPSPIDEEPAPKKRGRKRLRIDENADVSAIKLSEEQLRTLSSTEMEEIIKQRLNGRSMTVEERVEYQKQKRRIKNRESAFVHRQKKKVHGQELDRELKISQEEIAKLKMSLQQLEKENASLRKQVGTLDGKLQQIYDVAKRSGNVTLEALNKIRDLSVPSSETLKKIGSTLFIIFMSFGLILNIIMPINSVWRSDEASLVPNSPLPQQRSLLDYGVPEDSNFSLFDKSSESSSDESELNLEPSEDFEEKKLTLTPVETSQTPYERVSSNFLSPKSTPTPNLDSFNQLRSTNKQTAQPAKLQFGSDSVTASSTENLPTSFGEFMNESAPSNLSKLLDQEISPPPNETSSDFWNQVGVRPNTAYIKVDSLQQLSPPEAKPLDGNSPVYLSLVIPFSALTGQKNLEQDSGAFVQILTQLVDVSSKPQLPATSM